jgi:hypothetical protein
MEQVIGANLGMMGEGEVGFQASDSLDYSNPEAAARKADLSLARRYRNSTCFMRQVDGKYEKYPIWGTTLEEIGQYGSGMQLYLKLVKYLCFCFFVISGISIYPIYLNSKGDGLNAGEIRQRWDAWAVSNTDWVTDEDEKKDNEDNLFRLFVSDAVYSVFFILFVVFLQIRSNLTVQKNFQTNVTLADYSLEVKGLPEDDTEKESLKQHFQQFGEVHEVFLARKYDGLLKVYRERAITSNELAYNNLQKTFGKKLDKTINKLKVKIDKFDEKISKTEENSNKMHDELPVIKAFIVFNSFEARKSCFDSYKKDKGCCKRLKNQKENLKYKKIYPLRVTKTDAPSNILYENLEVSKCSRFIRRVISYFCVLICLIASAAMVYSLKIYQDDLPSRQKCLDMGVYKDYSLAVAKDKYTTNTEKYCYCKQQSISKIIDNSDMFDYCSYFIEKLSTTVLFRILVSFGVVFINFFIKIIFRILGRYERHPSKSEEQQKLMGKVFLATFINTALVILAVNADFSDLNTQSWLPEFIFNADYSDFSRDWYVEVGSTIVSTMMISIFSPHCVMLMTFYPLGLCKRHCCTKRYLSQAEANLKFSGADFDLATRNSFVMTVVFTCLLYSGGMPILNVICFLTMFCLYWVDKFLILRHYKRPPHYNHMLNEKVLQYLPFAVIFHCGFSLYMYGASDLFPLHLKGPYVEDQVPVHETNTLGDRIRRITGFVNIIIMIAAFLSLGWVVLYSSIFKCIMKRKVMDITEEKNAQGTIEHELNNIKAHDLDSYDIKKHPEYRDLIKSMESSVKRTRRLDSNAHDITSLHNLGS